jgi:DNA polymerase-3 subunit delta
MAPKEGRTVEGLRAQIARKALDPVYLFHGEEEFLLEEAVGQMIDSALTAEERSFNLDVVRAGEIDVQEIVARALSFPMMAGRRIMIVRDADRLAGDRSGDVLARYVQHPTETTTLVFIAAKVDFRKKPFSTIGKGGAVEFKRLREYQIPGWAATRAQSLGWSLAPDAAKLLAGYVGASLRDVQNELDKLFIFAGAPRELTGDDVAAVVGISKEFSIYELQRSIGARDLPRAVHILDRMLDMGEAPPFILAMLTGYFMSLWRLRELRRPGVAPADQAAGAKIMPFALQEYTDALQQYGAREVEQAFVLLAEADDRAKAGGGDPREVLEGLLIRLMRRSPSLMQA